jgi:3D (Asp-Asp-Asp) domain-containing protein
MRRTGLALSLLLAACGSSSSQGGATGDSGALDSSGDDVLSSGADGPSGAADAAVVTDARFTPDAMDSGTPPVDSGTPTSEASADSPPGDGSTTTNVYVTFYGWADNSPPGGAIAYPKSGGFPTLHDTAGGTGTYADPITFASDRAEFPVGTILYVPFIEKYVMMEDDCAQCDTDWTTSHKWHIDLWMNSSGTESTSALTTCEGNWTRTSTAVELSPPPARTVTTPPLFVPATNSCRTAP